MGLGHPYGDAKFNFFPDSDGSISELTNDIFRFFSFWDRLFLGEMQSNKIMSYYHAIHLQLHLDILVSDGTFFEF